MHSRAHFGQHLSNDSLGARVDGRRARRVVRDPRDRLNRRFAGGRRRRLGRDAGHAGGLRALEAHLGSIARGSVGGGRCPSLRCKLRVTDRTVRLRQAVLLAPVPLRLELGGQRRVAQSADRLRHAVLGAEGALRRSVRRAGAKLSLLGTCPRRPGAPGISPLSARTGAGGRGRVLLPASGRGTAQRGKHRQSDAESCNRGHVGSPR
jgi:hypothetical protein